MENTELCIDSTMNSCPCRISFRGSNFCDFVSRHFHLLQSASFDEVLSFSKSLCKDRRDLLLGNQDLKSKIINDRKNKIISYFKAGDIKRGDIVYCTKELGDVIFLDLKLSQDGFTGVVEYKTFNEEIKRAPIGSIVKISSGDYFSEYEVKLSGKKLRERSDFLEYLARYQGFRVEKSKIQNGIILKFFGDSQEQVEDFIVNCCYNKYILY